MSKLKPVNAATCSVRPDSDTSRMPQFHDEGMPIPPTALVLILTHNAPDALRICVARALEQLKLGDGIMVIDNASDPPAAATLQKRAGL